MKSNNKGKTCYITIDFEDWTTLPYLQKYNLSKSDCESFCVGPFWNAFLDELAIQTVKPTFFVVASTLEYALPTVLSIKEHGFFIGCHSLNHEDFRSYTVADFLENTREAKKRIEEVLNITVDCYRAPSFSITKEMVLALPEAGFRLDSSYIDSEANQFYTKKDFSDWRENADGILTNNLSEIVEAEIPTVKFFGRKVPIGGGGFFRLLPFWLYKYLVRKYLKTHNSYVFFIHPYELNFHRFPKKRILTLKEKTQFDLGRKKANKKFWRAVSFLKNEGLTFKDFSKGDY